MEPSAPKKRAPHKPNSVRKLREVERTRKAPSRANRKLKEVEKTEQIEETEPISNEGWEQAPFVENIAEVDVWLRRAAKRWESQESSRESRRAERSAARSRVSREVANELDVALLRAATEGDARRVESLLDKGADGNLADINGWSALHHSAALGHAGACVVLTQHVDDVNAAEFGTLWSPLHLAAINGSVDTCFVLIIAGANVKQRDKFGEVPQQQLRRDAKMQLSRWLHVKRKPDDLTSLLQSHSERCRKKEKLLEELEHFAEPFLAPTPDVDIPFLDVLCESNEATLCFDIRVNRSASKSDSLKITVRRMFGSPPDRSPAGGSLTLATPDLMFSDLQWIEAPLSKFIGDTSARSNVGLELTRNGYSLHSPHVLLKFKATSKIARRPGKSRVPAQRAKVTAEGVIAFSGLSRNPSCVVVCRSIQLIDFWELWHEGVGRPPPAMEGEGEEGKRGEEVSVLLDMEGEN